MLKAFKQTTYKLPGIFQIMAATTPKPESIDTSPSTPSPTDQATQEATDGVANLTVTKKKQRKQQTEEEFQAQKAQFLESGPRINTLDWLYDQQILDNLDNLKKTDRVHMLHACEKAYYMRDYDKCLELIAQAERLFGVAPGDNLEDIKNDFALAGRKTKKSLKVERHVVDLLHIKEACLKKRRSQ